MKLNKRNKALSLENTKGFTLIEILIVIGIIAILASIVIIAINPAKQFAQARNTQRMANVNAILNAIGQRIADNKGTFEGKFTIGGDDYYCPKLTSTNILTSSETTTGTTSGKLGCLVPTYIPALPTDPTWTSADGTDTLYDITLDKDCTDPNPKDAPGRVKLTAPESASPSKEPALPDAPAICVVR